MAPRRAPRLIKSTELILDQIRVKNFRSIEDQTVSLKPLTIIVGANSSGKSSLLKALLLLAQAQRESKTSGEVPLNGAWVRLEQFKSVINRGDDSKKLAIELGFQRDVNARRATRSSSEMVRSQWMRSGLADSILRLQYSLELGISERSKGVARIDTAELDVREDNDRSVTSFKVSRQLSGDNEDGDLLGLSKGEEILPFSGRYVSPDVETPEVQVDGAIFDVCVVKQVARNKRRSENLFDEVIHVMRDGFFTRSDEQKVLPDIPLEGIVGALANLSSKEALVGISDLVIDLMSLVIKDMRAKELPSPDEEDWLAWPIEIMIGQQAIRLLREVLKIIQRSNQGEISDLWKEILPYLRPQQMGQMPPGNLITLQMASRLMRFVSDAIRPESRSRWIEDLEEANKVWKTTVPVPFRERQLSGAEDLDRYLSSAVHYLGPLRMGPKTAADYELRGTERMIGPEGQHLAYQLMVNPRVWGFRWRNESKGFAVEDDLTSLSSALSYWAQRIGIASSVRGVEEPGVGDSIRMRVEGLDLEVSPNDVGVGVSQTLPVLAVILLANPGDLVVLEQPELHLHPSSQLELARFFVAAIRSGRRILIESHSEHFLNQLRLEITKSAEEDAKWLAESVGFVFAEKGERGQTEFQQVPLSPDGTLPVWPKGFFDQGSDVIREMIQIRRRAEGSATNR